MDSLPVDVIIVPDDKTQRKARELGKIIADNFDYYYTIADNRLIPHATVYQAQYPVKNLEKIKNKLKNLSAEFKPFEVSIGPYQNHHGYIWWNFQENENISSLHLRLLRELNPLRENLLLPFLTPKGYKTGEEFTKEEAENVRKYGAVVVDKLFKPHLTLAKLKKDVEESTLYKVLRKADCKFKVSKISIGKMGDYGTVTKVLEKYSMKI